jgi:hypothetical protein
MHNDGIEAYGRELTPGLFADFLMLDTECRKAVLATVNINQDVATIAKGDFHKLSISELWALELAILNAMPECDLLSCTWVIRSKFKAHVGDAVYANYAGALSASLADDNVKTLSSAQLTKEQIAELRGDNINLTRQMQRMAYYRLLRLHNIYHVKKNIIVIMAAVVVALLITIAGLNYGLGGRLTIHVSDDGQAKVHVGDDSSRKRAEASAGIPGSGGVKPGVPQGSASGDAPTGGAPAAVSNNESPVPEAEGGGLVNVDGILHSNGFYFGVLCIFMGMMGSCMSLMQRTEKATSAPSSFTDTALDSLDVKYSMSNIYIVSLALSGGVFAVVLYLLSLSGLMNVGDIFPKFEILDVEGEDCKGIRALFFCVDLDAKQVAKMLLVSFLAGFAERLVPDTLGSLVEKANQAKKSAPPAQ